MWKYIEMKLLLPAITWCIEAGENMDRSDDSDDESDDHERPTEPRSFHSWTNSESSISSMIKNNLTGIGESM